MLELYFVLIVVPLYICLRIGAIFGVVLRSFIYSYNMRNKLNVSAGGVLEGV